MQVENISPRLQQFMDWLNENDCLFEFFKSCGSGAGHSDWLTAWPGDWINRSMEWSSTEEEHDFWSEKHEEWEEWVRENPPELDYQGILNQFLVDNNAYTQFYSNLDSFTDGEDIEKEMEDIIDCTFDWTDTKQGAEFWGDINHKWQKHLEQLSDKFQERINRVDVVFSIPSDYIMVGLAETSDEGTIDIPEPEFPSNVAYR